MKKNKHRFVHQDPELQKQENSQGKVSSEPVKKIDNENYKYIKADLKQSIITISFFILLLITFYLVNNKYDILGYLKNIKF